MRGNILDRKWIDQRPQIVNQRKRIGDLEADIMLGKDRQPGLLVVLDRKSRKTWLRKLPVKNTDYVIAGSEPGSKYDKAQRLGVKILAERQFLTLLKA